MLRTARRDRVPDFFPAVFPLPIDEKPVPVFSGLEGKHGAPKAVPVMAERDAFPHPTGEVPRHPHFVREGVLYDQRHSPGQSLHPIGVTRTPLQASR